MFCYFVFFFARGGMRTPKLCRDRPSIRGELPWFRIRNAAGGVPG